MKPDELKLRIVRFARQTVDSYIPATDPISRLKNTTIQYWIEQNSGFLDKIFCAFADMNGNIDIDSLIRHYEAALFTDGEFRLDVKSMIPDSFIMLKNLLPDRIILFKREDLYRLFNVPLKDS